MRKIVLILAGLAFFVAGPAFGASLSESESSSSATGPDASAFSGVISLSISGEDPIAATTHISVATAEEGEASASTSGSSSASVGVGNGTLEVSTTDSTTGANATAGDDDDDDGTAVGIGVHGAALGGGEITFPPLPLPPPLPPINRLRIGAGGAISLSTASTGFADSGLAGATSSGDALATFSPFDEEADLTTNFSIEDVETFTNVVANPEIIDPEGTAYAAGLSTVFAAGGSVGLLADDFPVIRANAAIAGLDSVVYATGFGESGGVAALATTGAEGSASAENRSLRVPSFVSAQAAGQTDAAAQFFAQNGAGEVWAFSGKDAIALYAEFPEPNSGQILTLPLPEELPSLPDQTLPLLDHPPIVGPPSEINVAASTLFAGTFAEGFAEGGTLEFKASANAINDPPRPRFPIDPVASVSSPIGDAFAEIGALRGTAQASSNLVGGVVGTGEGRAGNLAIGLGVGAVFPGHELAALGLVAFAGAEGDGILSVNEARLENIYGNVSAAFLPLGPEGPLTWARMAEGFAWASAPDTNNPRTAGATFGVLEAWGNPIASFSIDLAIGGGIIPANYLSLGGGIGIGASYIPMLP